MLQMLPSYAHTRQKAMLVYIKLLYTLGLLLPPFNIKKVQ